MARYFDHSAEVHSVSLWYYELLRGQNCYSQAKWKPCVKALLTPFLLYLGPSCCVLHVFRIDFTGLSRILTHSSHLRSGLNMSYGMLRCAVSVPRKTT